MSSRTSKKMLQIRSPTIVIYLDDVTVFSRSDDEHLRHLRQVFQRVNNVFKNQQENVINPEPNIPPCSAFCMSSCKRIHLFNTGTVIEC